MKKITFYKTGSGKCPIEDHLDKLSDKQVEKIAWVLKIIREMNPVPTNYFKKLVNADDIWEVRVDVGRDAFRLLGFFHGTRIGHSDQFVPEENPKDSTHGNQIG